VRALIEKHRESNPMLGHRGVRLSISYPEITEMQARAIFEAAAPSQGGRARAAGDHGAAGRRCASWRCSAIITRVADEVFAERGVEIPYLVGTMIELPRAALMAGRHREHAEFFSFGTNDLTQTTFGISRDDAATFLPRYIEQGILEDDPFQVLDREGVGQLVQMATWEGRSAAPT
jgi:pyruvate, orthophosphate dikinase